MEDNTKEIEKFQRIIDNFPADSTAVKVAKEKLAQIQERKKVEVDKDSTGAASDVEVEVEVDKFAEVEVEVEISKSVLRTDSIFDVAKPK